MNKLFQNTLILGILAIVMIPAMVHSQISQNLSYTEQDELGPLNPYDYELDRGVSLRFFSMIYETLYQYNFENRAYESVLLDSEVKTGSDLYRFSLIDAYWHDGKKLTSDDVKFTFDYILEHGRNETVRSRINNEILEITVLSESEFSIQFSQGNSQFRSLLIQWILPKHVLDGDTITRQQFTRNPIGTGPYKFESRGRQGRAVLTRFENYHSSLPKMERIELRRIADTSSRIQALLSGGSDMLIEVPSERLLDLESNLRHQIEPYQSISINTISFNFNNPLLNDRNLRLAMTYGFNREIALNQWYEGQGTLISGPYSPASSLHDPDIRPKAFDPEEATRLLQNAGYEDQNGDGILRSPSGERLSFNILTRSTVGASELPAQMVAQDFVENMREIGIEINLVSEISDNFDRVVFYDRDFDLAIIEWTFDPRYNVTPLFHSDYIQRGGRNIGSYSNREVDDLFDALQSATQYRDRYRIAAQIQRKLSDEVPHIFMFSIMKNAAIDLRFTNVVIDPFYFFSYINKWELIDD